MPNEMNPGQPTEPNGTEHEDEPIPRASEDKVLEETARLVREGRKEREADPKEPKTPAD